MPATQSKTAIVEPTEPAEPEIATLESKEYTPEGRSTVVVNARNDDGSGAEGRASDQDQGEEGESPVERKTRWTERGVSCPEGYVPVGARRSVALATSSHGLTVEWLTGVFQERGFLRRSGCVTSVSVRPLGEGEGVMGLLAICTVELQGALDHAPPQFVAKFSPVKTSMPGFLLRSVFGAEAH